MCVEGKREEREWIERALRWERVRAVVPFRSVPADGDGDAGVRAGTECERWALELKFAEEVQVEVEVAAKSEAEAERQRGRARGSGERSAHRRERHVRVRLWSESQSLVFARRQSDADSSL